MKSKSVLVFFLSVFCFSLPKADGYVDFNDGQTHYINYTIHEQVRVDWGTPGMQTTVNCLEGANVNFLSAFEESRVNVFGGVIASDLKGYDNSVVNIYGGRIMWQLVAFDNSQIFVSGGIMDDPIYAQHNSQITISGGIINGTLHAGHTDSIIDNSAIIIEGTNFAINGQNVDYGQYFRDDYANGTLTGILANGDLLNEGFYIFDSASIMLTPEPTTLLLLGLGAVMLRKGGTFLKGKM